MTNNEQALELEYCPGWRTCPGECAGCLIPPPDLEPIHMLTMDLRPRIDEIVGEDLVARVASPSPAARAREANVIDALLKGGREISNISTSPALAAWLYFEVLDEVVTTALADVEYSGDLIADALNPRCRHDDLAADVGEALRSACTITEPLLSALPSRIAVVGAFDDLVVATYALAASERAYRRGPHERRPGIRRAWQALATAVGKIDGAVVDWETAKKAIERA
ncbi:MAG: hypothetical protein M3O36_20715 [Myxococcota bacterium]|nr:hypothetical protein [Myxococcota bacterium]